MRIAVLGGNGELGSYLCPLLVEEGHEVTSVTDDNLEPYMPENPAWKKVKRVVMDRTSLESEAFGLYGKRVADLKPEVVVDAGCYTMEHCKGLVSALRGTGVQHTVHVGSTHLYSPSQPRPWVEDAPRAAPCGQFALEQQNMESYLIAEHKESKYPVTIMLLSNLVGKGWVPLSPQGTYDPVVFEAIKSGGKIMLPKVPCCVQLLHAGDAAQAVAKCIALRTNTTGEVYNFAGVPLSLVAYVQAVGQHVYKQAAVPCMERDMLQFMDALETTDKAEKLEGGVVVGEWQKAVSLEAADELLRNPAALWIKAEKALGVQPRAPVLAVADALEWMDEHPGEAARPRAPAPYAFTGGREPFIQAEGGFTGSKAGYYFRQGKDGLGYYLDHGVYVNWQLLAWRQLQKQYEDDALLGEQGEKTIRALKYFIPGSLIFWAIFLTWLFVTGETMQGLLVYMAWVPGLTGIGALPPFTPKPFTSAVRVKSTARVELGVWHTALPARGYNATYTKEERSAAAERCRAVLYLHGNAETRSKQGWKLGWYHTHAKADVVTMDYRGFGDSTCSTEAFRACLTERGLYEDAYSVFEWMTNSTKDGGLGIPHGCIVLHGHSLGAAVATRVAGVLSSQGKAPAGVILESGFTSMLEVMRVAWMSPLAYLPDGFGDFFVSVMDKPARLQHTFMHSTFIKKVSSPVLLLHGEKDVTVPAEMSSELFKARVAVSDGEAVCEDGDGKGAPCTDLLSLPEADHSDVMTQYDSQNKVLEFTTKVWALKGKAR